jgi:hypothetical protein
VDPAERDHVFDLFLLELLEMGHPAPIVNMVDIRQIHGDSLSTIPEEHSESTGSTHAITNPYEKEFPAFPADFGGAIFAISADQPSREWETDQERADQVERNANCMAHRVERENAKYAKERRPIQHDLVDAFDMYGNQQVHKTPSANIAIAMNELAKLP